MCVSVCVCVCHCVCLGVCDKFSPTAQIKALDLMVESALKESVASALWMSERFSEKWPESADGRVLAARLNFWRNDLAAVAKELDAIALKNASNYEAAVLRGLVQHRKRNLKGAIEAFERALNLTPNPWHGENKGEIKGVPNLYDTQLNIAGLYQELFVVEKSPHFRDRAIEILDSAMNQDPSRLDAILMLARLTGGGEKKIIPALEKAIKRIEEKRDGYRANNLRRELIRRYRAQMKSGLAQGDTRRILSSTKGLLLWDKSALSLLHRGFAIAWSANACLGSDISEQQFSEKQFRESLRTATNRLNQAITALKKTSTKNEPLLTLIWLNLVEFAMLTNNQPFLRKAFRELKNIPLPYDNPQAFRLGTLINFYRIADRVLNDPKNLETISKDVAMFEHVSRLRQSMTEESGGTIRRIDWDLSLIDRAVRRFRQLSKSQQDVFDSLFKAIQPILKSYLSINSFPCIV